MKFKKIEVVNDKGKTVFHCGSLSCIPSGDELTSMLRAGYKIKIDGVVATKKKIKEITGE